MSRKLSRFVRCPKTRHKNWCQQRNFRTFLLPLYRSTHLMNSLCEQKEINCAKTYFPLFMRKETVWRIEFKSFEPFFSQISCNSVDYRDIENLNRTLLSGQWVVDSGQWAVDRGSWEILWPMKMRKHKKAGPRILQVGFFDSDSYRKWIGFTSLVWSRAFARRSSGRILHCHR